MATQSTGVLTEGHVAPGFEPVRQAFQRNFTLYGEAGASCAVYLDGEKKVDLWGGTAGTSTVAEQSAGRDRVTDLDARFGTGFMLPTAGTPMLSTSSFGHEGVGEALGFADRDWGVGFGYVQNSLRWELTGAPDPRVAGLVAALRDCLGLRAVSGH